ncbi:uncharacterized protein LOC131675430 [Phymastichus coffea]|uniref:uncharacterized protein LOC131675430 n=1 Tax=Phymastichus coffea TaxID=108790 RepID=UPI00273BD38B|nr:uncharacterized protein LOC131675430 [Phymastichus coffea]
MDTVCTTFSKLALNLKDLQMKCLQTKDNLLALLDDKKEETNKTDNEGTMNCRQDVINTQFFYCRKDLYETRVIKQRDLSIKRAEDNNNCKPANRKMSDSNKKYHDVQHRYTNHKNVHTKSTWKGYRNVQHRYTNQRKFHSKNTWKSDHQHRQNKNYNTFRSREKNFRSKMELIHHDKKNKVRDILQVFYEIFKYK